MFPHYRKHNPLRAVGENASLEAAAEEANHTLLFDDGLRGLHVPVCKKTKTNKMKFKFSKVSFGVRSQVSV